MNDNPMFQMYKFLKEKGLIKKLKPEYEDMIKEENSVHKKWLKDLSPEDREKFNRIFK